MTPNPVSCEAFVRMDLTPPMVSEGIVSVTRQQKWPEGIPMATERGHGLFTEQNKTNAFSSISVFRSRENSLSSASVICARHESLG